MVKLSLEDVTTIYGSSLFIRKGRLVKVREVKMGDAGVEVKFFDLRSRRCTTVPFVQEEFKTPMKRLGFINYNKCALYVVRAPLRMYKGGIAFNNVEIRYPSFPGISGGALREALQGMQELDSPALLAAYDNDYPSIQKAGELAKEWGGCCAFDKQFAVGATGILFYKDNAVGVVVNDKPVFTSDKEYLKTLLDNNHDKAIRTVGPSPL